MKKYYQTLNKKEKEKIKELYKKEYSNKEIYARLTRLLVFSCLAIISAIIILVLSFKYEENHITSILLAIILIISSIIFFLGHFYVKLNILNKIALKNKK